MAGVRHLIGWALRHLADRVDPPKPRSAWLMTSSTNNDYTVDGTYRLTFLK